MNENQRLSLINRLNLRIIDPKHINLRDYPKRNDLILLQTLITDQQKEIERLREKYPEPAETPAAA